MLLLGHAGTVVANLMAPSAARSAATTVATGKASGYSPAMTVTIS
jgi:hypothetical protein